MPTSQDDSEPLETFSMRVAARMTGVSPERIRAWESRHDAIRPQRTAGGTRRYTLSDLDRLRLLREVVEAGHRIGDVAGLDLAGLTACLSNSSPAEPTAFDDLLEAVERLDSIETRRLLSARQQEVGDIAFARDVALPLCEEIGRRWAAGILSISAEHLATVVVRSMLVDALERAGSDSVGPRIVFATPPDERHDLGLLVAALAAKRAGASPIFLGAEVPEENLLESVRATRAEVLALGFVTSPPERVEAILRRIRRALPDSVELWIGGAGIAGCAPVEGVDRIDNFERLEAYVLQCSGPVAS